MKTKKFVWREDKPEIVYRPGTSDEAIIQTNLVEKKEYAFLMPQSFGEGGPKVIFDIGGNIGIIAVIMANIYPDAKIYSFEPVPSNFELLKQNAAPYPNIVPLNYGLAGETGSRRIWHSDDDKNLGGFSTVIKVPDGKTELIQVRDVAAACQEFGNPDIIKIDVEGAEAEIFESFPNLEKTQWIAGELHGIRDFQILDLLSRTFYVQCARMFTDKVWHFHAVSKGLAESHAKVQQRENHLRPVQ